MTFLMQDGSYVLEGVRKVQVFTKDPPRYDTEEAEWDMQETRDPVQIRVWFEEGMGGLDLVPAPLGESAEGSSLAHHRQSANATLGAPSESSFVNEVAPLSGNQEEEPK